MSVLLRGPVTWPGILIRQDSNPKGLGISVAILLAVGVVGLQDLGSHYRSSGANDLLVLLPAIVTSVFWRVRLIEVNCLLAHVYGAAWLETTIQAGAERLILSPGHFVVQTISWLQEPNRILFSPIKGAKLPVARRLWPCVPYSMTARMALLADIGLVKRADSKA